MSDLSPEDQQLLQEYLFSRQSVDPNAPSHDLLSQYPQLAQAPVTPSGDFDLGSAAPAPENDISEQGEGPTSGIPQEPVSAPSPMAASTQPLPSSIGQVVGPKYSDDARSQLYQQLQARNPMAILGTALSGFGDAVANSYGTGGAHHQQDTQNVIDAKRNAALQEFERGRTEQIQNFDQNLKLQQGQRDAQLFQGTQQQAAIKRDPTSSISQEYQTIAARYTGLPPENFKGMSADQLAQQLPVIEKAYVAEQNTKAHTAMASAVQGNRVDLKSQSAAEAMGKDLDPSQWSSRTSGGQAASRYNAGQRAMQLIEQGKTQSGGLDARQTQELATSVNTLVSGGASGAAREIDALVPHTMWGKAKSFQEYLTNNPTGLQQQDFTNRLADTVHREMGIADTQIKQAQAQRLGSHQWLQQNRPDLYQSVLQRTGIDPSTLDAQGRYQQPVQQSGSQGAPQWAPQSAPQVAPGEVARMTKDGKTAIFDAATKQFKRWG